MAADSWFRMYNTAVDNPKVMMLSDAHFRAWVRMLSLASKMGGVIPPDMPLIAMTLRKSPGKAADIVQVLQSAVLLDLQEGGGWVPHNWSEKQFKSDVSTGRVQAFRERSRNVSETDHKQRQSTETKKKKEIRAPRFDDFWDACPKKVGRGPAEKAWPKACQLSDPDTLIAAMRVYATTCLGKEKAYIKTPGPWLNEKRWLDEGIAPAAPPDAAAIVMACSAWDGRAAPLVEEIGPAKFQAWFGDAVYEAGPPITIRFSKPFQRNYVSNHFGRILSRHYGDIALEAA